MLTDQQITDIAREYGKEKANEYSYAIYRDPDTKREIKACSIANQAAPIIRWLSQRFCLVEESRVKDEYEKAQIDMKSKYHQGSMVVLQVLFPEIAKEVEV